MNYRLIIMTEITESRRIKDILNYKNWFKIVQHINKTTKDCAEPYRRNVIRKRKKN